MPFYDIATRRIYGKNTENSYINPLPNNRKALSFHSLNGYENNTLETILVKYYEKSVREFRKYIENGLNILWE